MLRLIAFLLEFLRFIFILMILIYVLGTAEIYMLNQTIGWNRDLSWCFAVSNLIVGFVLYRNYFQFKGWFKSPNNKRLNHKTIYILLVFSLAFLMAPVIFK